jgi:uncharacterized protein
VLRFALFFLIMTGVLALLNLHAERWASEALALSRRQRFWLRTTLFGSLGLMVLSRLGAQLWLDAPLSPLIALGSVVQLTVLISCILLLPLDLAFLLQRLWRSVKGIAGQKGHTSDTRVRDVEPPKINTEATLAAPLEVPLPRRTFLGQAAAGSSLLIASSSSVYGALAGRHDYQIEEQPVALPGLARALDGFTIVQLSDIHVGSFVGEAELAAAYSLVAKARPDLIVLTGDLLDNDARLADRLGRFVRRAGPLARHGVVAISGNHDFYAGIDPTVSALERGGATVLRNRGLVIGDAGGAIALLGVDDVMGPRFGGYGPDLSAALNSLPGRGRELPRVLLCHNPSYFEDSAGRVGLQLSGHTHGGQINLGLRPADWILKNGWVAGSYQSKGSQLYINRGFGTVGPPVRVGSPPEVSRIVLTV